MSFKKWRKKAATRLASWFLHKLIIVIGATWKIRISSGQERTEKLLQSGEIAVFTFWHNRIIFFIKFFRKFFVSKGYPLVALISQSEDGELASQVVQAFGGGVIRGSSSKGGRGAFLQMFRTIKKEKKTVLVVPDGPRGPVYHFKPGAVQLAEKVNMPIYLFNYTAQDEWIFNSWDKFSIPKPFSKIEVRISEPFEIDFEGGISDEQWAQKLGEQMLALSDKNPG